MRVLIDPLALVKMIKSSMIHKETAGLIIGKELKEDTLYVTDSIWLRKIGGPTFIEISGEIINAVAESLDILSVDEFIIGWYHSHPGFKCFLSHIDIATQRQFQQIYPNAIAIVVDPFEEELSNKIKVFRLVNYHKVEEVGWSMFLSDLRRDVLLKSISHAAELSPEELSYKLLEALLRKTSV